MYGHDFDEMTRNTVPGVAPYLSPYSTAKPELHTGV
jgi:hypothetical protein